MRSDKTVIREPYWQGVINTTLPRLDPSQGDLITTRLRHLTRALGSAADHSANAHTARIA